VDIIFFGVIFCSVFLIMLSSSFASFYLIKYGNKLMGNLVYGFNLKIFCLILIVNLISVYIEYTYLNFPVWEPRVVPFFTFVGYLLGMTLSIP